MHHKAVLSKSESEIKPWHAACSCGPTGDFVDEKAARGYLSFHLAKQGGINTVEFVDETAPLVVEEPSPEAQAAEMVSEGAPAEQPEVKETVADA